MAVDVLKRERIRKKYHGATVRVLRSTYTTLTPFTVDGFNQVLRGRIFKVLEVQDGKVGICNGIPEGHTHWFHPYDLELVDMPEEGGGVKEESIMKKTPKLKKKYIVGIREVHVSSREVLADSPEDAKEIAAENLDTEVMLEFSHALGTDTWTVEEVDEPEELCEAAGIPGTPCNKDNCNSGCL